MDAQHDPDRYDRDRYDPAPQDAGRYAGDRQATERGYGSGASEPSGDGWPPAPQGSEPPGHAQPPAEGRSRSKTLAVIALVAAVVALLLAVVPALGSLAALAALGFAVVVLVGARRGQHGGAGIAVAGVALSAVAAVLSLALLFVTLPRISEALSGDATPDQPRASVAPSPSTTPGDAAPAPETTAEDPPGDAPSGPPAPPPDASDRPPQLMAPGTSVTLGDWQVEVQEVQPDADENVAAASSINEAPTGQYVAAVVEVTYTGPDIERVGVEVQWHYLGTDARTYREANVYLEGQETLPSEVRDGDVLTFPVFFDVPADAVEGGAVQVDVGYDPDAYQARWAVPTP